MTRIVAVSGSLRRASLNSGLLRAARELAPDGCTIDIVPIADIPLYDGDAEDADGIPPAAAALKDAIADADGLLIASPEYNNGVPGVLKNAIDWASRPTADIGRVFGGRKAAIIGATPGPYGTALGQTAWLPVLRQLGVELWSGGRLMVGSAGKLFDGEGDLTDAAMRDRLAKFVAGFADWIG